MKKKNLIMAIALASIVCSCQKAELIEEEITETSTQLDSVTIHFSTPYTIEPFTRTATSIAPIVSHLDVYLIEGTNTYGFHQIQTDDDFGTLRVNLDRTKIYTLVAVAHKCNGNATISDGIITFPDEKVSHSMIYTTTFSPATTTTINAEMTRIVGQFRFEVADQVPDEVYTMTFNFGQSFTRWNYASAVAANAVARTVTFSNFSRTNEGTVTFNLFVIPTNLTDTYQMDITVTAYKENGDEIESKTFTNVPIKAGYKTTYHGQFFTTTSSTATFTVDDWLSFDTINF